jgi:enamine deaminase RidA (YjgF/YER057c/UK114 family)
LLEQKGNEMKRINIPSESPLATKVGISRAVRKGNFIALSGCAPVNPDGSTAHIGDVYGQTKTCIEIMKKAIEAAGGKLEDVMKVQLLVKDVSKWEEVFKAFGEYFSDIKPACFMFEVKGFINKDWLIETDAECMLDS